MLVIIPQSEVGLKLSVGLFNSMHPFQLCSGVTNPERSPLPLPFRCRRKLAHRLCTRRGVFQGWSCDPPLARC